VPHAGEPRVVGTRQARRLLDLARTYTP